MKWYSVKKYKPPSDDVDCLVSTSYGELYIGRYTIKDNLWFQYDDHENYIEVTHFCIPDAIPLDDE